MTEGPMKPIMVTLAVGPASGRNEATITVKEVQNFSPAEKDGHEGDELSKSYLIMSLTNEIY